MNDISSFRATIWCNRFRELMERKGYTQEEFLKEYKNKYGGGTQANVSRWLRVGNKIEKDGVTKIIGFPSYENMLNIADFFGVTIGYLTGEIDCETFEMEKICQVLEIDKDTYKAIKNITSGKGIPLSGRFRAKDYSDAMKILLTTNSFPTFIKKIRDYLDWIDRREYPVNYMERVANKINNKNLYDLALRCYLESEGEKNDECKKNNTKELQEAVDMIGKAIDKMGSDNEINEQMIKLAEYELQKVYFDLIRDIASKK